MPRDSNGIYTLPVGNPVVSGTVIESVWANTTMTDIAQALTNSMSRDGSAPMTGTLQVASGNLSFGGTAQRILGDFSNSAPAQRLLFQSNVVNGNTVVGAIPNGTAGVSSFMALATADPGNASFIEISANFNTACLINAGKAGTGTFLPMAFHAGGSERFRLSETANRFQADFSNAVQPQRFLFQSSIVNGFTNVGAVPNGTSTSAVWTAFNNADPENSGAIQLEVTSALATLRSTRVGTGTFLPLVFETSNAARMHINTIGQVGVGGTPEGNGKLDILGNAAGSAQIVVARGVSDPNFQLWMSNGASGGAGTVQASISMVYVGVGTGPDIRYLRGGGTIDGSLTFNTSGTERMRVDGSGTIMAGKTSANAQANGWQFENATAHSIFTMTNDYAMAGIRVGSDGAVMIFQKAAAGVGSISVTASATAYNTTSDYRLKKNVQAMVAPLVRLLRLNPVQFDWIANDSEGEGFIAHELQKEVPLAVTGEKDGEEMQQVDHSKLVPLLVAAVQELAHEVAMLKAGLGSI